MGLSGVQKRVQELDKKCGWTNDTPLQNLAHLSEEVGEMARLLLAKEGYKRGVKFSKKKLAEELVDTLYLTAKIANKFDINLDDAWRKSEKRYIRKANG